MDAPVSPDPLSTAPPLWVTETWRVVAVMAGGAVGCAARYAIGRLAVHHFAQAIGVFPWPTFFINVLGSFILGVVAVFYSKAHPHPPMLWLILGTGFCGGFTTFSTFSLELFTLMEKGRPGAAFLYAGGSVTLGLSAAWLAVKLARLC